MCIRDSPDSIGIQIDGDKAVVNNDGGSAISNGGTGTQINGDEATVNLSLIHISLTFEPGALLRSKGRVIDSLDIDEIRWPLAGVKVTQRGVDGRL